MHNDWSKHQPQACDKRITVEKKSMDAEEANGISQRRRTKRQLLYNAIPSRYAEEVLAAYDDEECQCRPCPDGMTSLGGFPHLAACFPLQRQQQLSFGLAFSLELKELFYHQKKENGLDLNTLATAVGYSIADTLSTMPLSKAIGTTEPMLSMKMVMIKPQGHGQFVAKFDFQGGTVAISTLLDLISSVLLSDVPSQQCHLVSKAIGIDLCKAVSRVTSIYQLTELYGEMDYDVLVNKEEGTLFKRKTRKLYPIPTPAPFAKAPQVRNLVEAKESGGIVVKVLRD